jgi:hypothetical protein
MLVLDVVLQPKCVTTTLRLLLLLPLSDEPEVHVQAILVPTILESCDVA